MKPAGKNKTTLKRGIKISKNKTIRFRSSNKTLISFEKEIVVKFLQMLNTIKLFHWRTYSYPAHKATDDLYESLNSHIDRFIEILLGKTQNRIKLGSKTLTLKDVSSVISFRKEVDAYKTYLVGLDTHRGLLTMSNTDLFTIRDEILGDLNQFLYLTTFK